MGVATCVKEREAKQISIMLGKCYYNNIYLIYYSALCRIYYVIIIIFIVIAMYLLYITSLSVCLYTDTGQTCCT